jgi:hypothetical protein
VRPLLLRLYSAVDSEVSKMWPNLLKLGFRGRLTKELRSLELGMLAVVQFRVFSSPVYTPRDQSEVEKLEFFFK